MSVNWEFLTGDTSRFAVRIALSPDPFEGRGVTDEVSASWGAFEIWVDGRNLCAQIETGDTLNAVHWYLLPVLEWFVENWDPLLHEERPPIGVAAPTAVRSLHDTVYAALDEPLCGGAGWQPWWSRHSLLAARDGGLFPEVVFRRWRDQVEISWDSRFIPGAPLQLAFSVPQGNARLPPAQVALPLATMIRAVVAELLGRRPASARLRALSDGLAALESQQRQEQRLAWLAALGSSLAEMLAKWRTVAARLLEGGWQAVTPGEGLFIAGSSKAGLLFGAVAPDISERDVENLIGFLLALSAHEGEAPRADGDEWSELAARLDPRSAPWHQGYELAQSCLEHLGVDPTNPVDVDKVLEVLGVQVHETPLEDAAIRGLAAAGPGQIPSIALNPNYPLHDREDVRRFTKGHELCHILFDRSAAREVAEASGPWAPLELEQRANAFSAMLLMPEPLLRAEVGAMSDSSKGLDELAHVADRLEVSRVALLRHATNLGVVPRSLVQRAEVEGLLAPGSANGSFE